MRWGSLLKMIRRFLRTKIEIEKTLIDHSRQEDMLENEIQQLRSLMEVFQAVEMSSKALSSNKRDLFERLCPRNPTPIQSLFGGYSVVIQRYFRGYEELIIKH